MGKPRVKPNYRRRVLRLPDLDHCKTAVLNSLGSPASCTSTISGTAGSTSFFLKKSCLETKRFSRHAWRVNDVVRPKTVEGHKDLQSFSKHSRTPITRVTMRLVSGLAILFLNPSLQMTLTDDYTAGKTDADKSRVDECYRLIASGDNFVRAGRAWSPRCYCSFAYSALASFRMGMSGSASFQSVRKSL